MPSGAHALSARLKEGLEAAGAPLSTPAQVSPGTAPASLETTWSAVMMACA